MTRKSEFTINLFQKFQHNSLTFCFLLSFSVCVNYEALLSLGSSRCCQSFCHKVRCSDRANYDDIEYSHQPLKIYTYDHVDNVHNFLNYFLAERKRAIITDDAKHSRTMRMKYMYTVHNTCTLPRAKKHV